MWRWQATRLGDVGYRLRGAALVDHVGKRREAMIGRSRWSSRLRGTPCIIAAPLYRRLLAQAAVIRR
jgi:hypothetical protein